MTVFEILNFNRELLNRLVVIGFKPDDCKYIDLYAEYERMHRKGEKMTYIVSFLFHQIQGIRTQSIWDNQTV